MCINQLFVWVLGFKLIKYFKTELFLESLSIVKQHYEKIKLLVQVNKNI